MTERRKAVAHYAAQEDAARDYADARRYRWLREQEDISIAACWLLPVERIKHAKPPPEKIIQTPQDLDAAIDMELERAGRANG